jgi:hypothetical protein
VPEADIDPRTKPHLNCVHKTTHGRFDGVDYAITPAGFFFIKSAFDVGNGDQLCRRTDELCYDLIVERDFFRKDLLGFARQDATASS